MKTFYSFQSIAQVVYKYNTNSKSFKQKNMSLKIPLFYVWSLFLLDICIVTYRNNNCQLHKLQPGADIIIQYLIINIRISALFTN